MCVVSSSILICSSLAKPQSVGTLRSIFPSFIHYSNQLHDLNNCNYYVQFMEFNYDLVFPQSMVAVYN